MTYGDYPSFHSVQKILVVKLRQLGDVLLSTPVLSTLKRRFPNAQIDLYIYSESIPLVDNHPALSECIGYDRKWKKLSFTQRIIQEAKVLWRLRKKRYDLVINLTEGDRGAIAAQMSRAPIRVGIDSKGSGLFWKKNLYTHTVKQCPSLRHTVERNLDALRRIGLFPSLEDRELFLSVSEEALARMKSQVPTSFLLIHPTSRWRFKCWPVEKMRAVSELLLNRGLALVFSSGPDREELAMVDAICKGIPVINLAGKISLPELAALVLLSDQLLCVDSLPFHMASALKKRVVALFGPTSDVTWGPWRNPHAIVLTQPFSCRPCYQDGCGGSKISDCLTSLSVDRVLEALLGQKLTNQ